MTYKKRSPITMSPGELMEHDQTSRVMAEARRRDREWDRLIDRNARAGIFRHAVDPDDPWSELEWSKCPPNCRKHGGQS